jgi:hypothetical protein
MKKNQLQQKYRELSEQLSTIGYICKGSVMRLYLTCGKPNCQCKTDKKAKHGPYNVWTRKVNGKTVTKYLSDKQADLCREFIQNSKRLEATIKDMRNLSAKLIETETQIS